MTGLIVLILLAALFVPDYGVYWRFQRRRWLQSRQAIEDALTHLHQRQYDEQRSASVETLSNALGTTTKDTLTLVNRIAQQELIAISGQGIRLTPVGYRWALQVIRAHRLLERYMADETAVPMAEIHMRADLLEHTITEAEVDKMDADLGHPAFDPQGDPIPTATGDIQVVESQSLLDWPLDTLGEIVHIEDEPPEVFAQILAEGLNPGMLITILENSSVRLVIETNTAEHILAPVVAANISVREPPATILVQEGIPLTTLEKGHLGRVVGLSPSCQGLTRRRFQDLGITTGVKIERVMQSAFKDPTAYRVRNTLIALRREQSDLIWIEDETTKATNQTER
jgi:DtxR family transcriptional regulator, Mn-dependent transcriptional regulator